LTTTFSTHFLNYSAAIWPHCRCLRKFCTWASRLTHASNQKKHKRRQNAAFLPRATTTAENKTETQKGNNKLSLLQVAPANSAAAASVDAARRSFPLHFQIFSFSSRWNVEQDGACPRCFDK